MPDFYYRDGGTWRKISQIHYKDAGVWRRLKEVWYRDAGVWRKVFQGAGVVSPLEGGLAMHAGLYTGSGYAGWRFGSDGKVWKLVGSNMYEDHAWYLPYTLGISNEHVIRFTKTGGNGTLANSGVWRTFDEGANVTLEMTSQGTKDLQFTTDIAATAAGPILTSGSYSIVASMDF